MSCNNCDTEQESNEPKDYYIRVGKANILVHGCEEHVKELIETLRAVKAS